MRILLAAATALVLAGCASSVPGTAVDVSRPDPDSVAGLAITTGDSGLRPDAPAPGREVRNTDGGEIDRVAVNAVADVSEYWRERFPQQFGQEFEDVRELVSYDSRTDTFPLCGTDVRGLVNAFYCTDDLVAWDRGELLPSLDEISIVAVLAHELGHAVQFRLGVAPNTPSIVKEQQADCYAGNYFRWVAENRSARFRLATGPGLNRILATLFSIRDSAGTSFDAEGAHGTAFDRVTAFQFGFAEDARRCAAISEEEIVRRSTQQVFGPSDVDVGLGRGNIRVDTPEALQSLRDSLTAAFPGLDLRFDDGCRVTTPAAYCPAAVGVDVPALAKLGQVGDFAAFGAVASRYALGVQDAAQLPVTGPAAAQRTACLTGRWAASLVDDAALRLSPGDLDEAVVELLSPGSLIASDAEGNAVPSGFARVAAFRDGFLSGSADTCQVRYRET